MAIIICYHFFFWCFYFFVVLSPPIKILVVYEELLLFQTMLASAAENNKQQQIFFFFLHHHYYYKIKNIPTTILFEPKPACMYPYHQTLFRFIQLSTIYIPAFNDNGISPQRKKLSKLQILQKPFPQQPVKRKITLLNRQRRRHQ